uniref:Inositol monophosphatase n=1 Tax=Agrobacterium albertimagni TaxID=147266 RepID=A0A7C1SV19_9HYPH
MIFRDSDLFDILDLVRTAGQREILPRFRRFDAPDVVEKKSSIDLVTDADLETEAYLTAALADADLAFVIDPVDGTFNFQAGLPVFGTNLAVVKGGETVAALIHDSVLGDTLIATKAAGARWLRADGIEAAIRVAAATDLSMMVGTISINDISREERRRIAGNLAQTKMAFAYNCSAYEYWLVATGKVHFIGHHKLMPWDHLAGVLLHEEAGGVTRRFDGSPYLPGQTTGGILSAPDADSWEMILSRVVLAS